MKKLIVTIVVLFVLFSFSLPTVAGMVSKREACIPDISCARDVAARVSVCHNYGIDYCMAYEDITTIIDLMFVRFILGD
jgi:hypothetical protein